jgi:carnitine-CoA ligase
MSTSTRILIRGVPVPWQTMAELVRGKADAHGDRVFATIDWRTLTYRELDQLSSRVAANLAAAGIEEGACVASVMFNCVEQVLGWVGSGKAGALWAPLNASLVGDDLAQTLADAQPDILIVDAENAVKLAALPRALLDRMRVYCTGPALPGLAALPFAALLEGRSALSDRERGPGDPALILYTGGTTGLPKGVVLPHFAVVSAGYRYGETLGATAADRHYTTLPLFHASGIQLGIVGPLLNDMTTVMDRRFSGSGFWPRVVEVGATIIDPISTMMSVLVQQPASPLDRQHRVRITTGVNGQVPPAVPEEFTRRFGVPIVDIYGASETGGAMATGNRLGSAQPGSVGRPHGWSEVAVVDDNDCPVPPGTQGGIVLRPTIPFTFMLGYHNNPEATRRAWRNLWFHSGDLGRMDAAGNLFFAGREAHWLRRRGENISAYEIEAVLARHAAVREVIITGVPAELGDEDVKAWIVPEGPCPDEAALVAWCAARLAAFKVPRFIAFVEDFPRSAAKREVERTKVKAWSHQDCWDRERSGLQLSSQSATRRDAGDMAKPLP